MIILPNPVYLDTGHWLLFSLVRFMGRFFAPSMKFMAGLNKKALLRIAKRGRVDPLLFQFHAMKT